MSDDAQANLPFEGDGRLIRRQWHEGRWFFSVVDVVAVLTDSDAPSKYWSAMKARIQDEGFREVSTLCRQLRMRSLDGKRYATDAADTETLLRIVQSIPSPKAEPFKQWLARVGTERLEEVVGAVHAWGWVHAAPQGQSQRIAQTPAPGASAGGHHPEITPMPSPGYATAANHVSNVSNNQQWLLTIDCYDFGGSLVPCPQLGPSALPQICSSNDICAHPCNVISTSVRSTISVTCATQPAGNWNPTYIGEPITAGACGLDPAGVINTCYVTAQATQ